MKILCLHGLAASGAYFEQLKNELKKLGADVATPDLPGYGKNLSLASDYSLQSYLDFITNEIKENEKVTLIGHSAGGVLALAWAAQNPEKVEKIILLNTPLAETRKEVKEKIKLNKLSWSYIMEFYPHLSKSLCTILCQKGYMNYFHFLKPSFIPEQVFKDYTQHTFSSINGSFKSIVENTPTIPLIQKLHTPLLALAGTNETELFFSNKLPQIKIPGAHHILHQSFPETLHTIKTFLDKQKTVL